MSEDNKDRNDLDHIEEKNAGRKEELTDIFEDLKKKEDMRFLDPATEEEIGKFEEEHDIILPEQYKEWLKLCDGGEVYLPAGIQFYGVAHKPIIDTDDEDRPDVNYIVIGALANGDPIVFEKGKEDISIYNRDGGRIEDDETYKDFVSFMNDLNGILGLEECANV